MSAVISMLEFGTKRNKTFLPQLATKYDQGLPWGEEQAGLPLFFSA